MTRLGDLGNLGFLKDLSLFNYLSAGTILQHGGMLMNELSIVVDVGLIAQLCALYTFQKRELAFQANRASSPRTQIEGCNKKPGTSVYRGPAPNFFNRILYSILPSS